MERKKKKQRRDVIITVVRDSGEVSGGLTALAILVWCPNKNSDSDGKLVHHSLPIIIKVSFYIEGELNSWQTSFPMFSDRTVHCQDSKSSETHLFTTSS